MSIMYELNWQFCVLRKHIFQSNINNISFVVIVTSGAMDYLTFFRLLQLKKNNVLYLNIMVFDKNHFFKHYGDATLIITTFSVRSRLFIL